MGGQINIAIRFRDGRAICVERWTNSMPIYFKDRRFFEGDEAFVQSYLDLTKDADYANDPLAMGRPMPLRNNEYGIVVWDFVANVCLDNNHYSFPNQMSEIDAKGTVRPQSREMFLDHARHGRVILRSIHYGPRDEVWEEKKRLTYQEAIEAAERVYRHRWSQSGTTLRVGELSPDGTEVVEDFLLDMSPLEYICFGDHTDPGNWTQMRETLKQIGFPLNKAEGLNASLPKLPRYRPKEATTTFS